MKKYKFVIRKMKEMEIEVSAKNHSEAMIELLRKVVENDEEFLKEKDNEKEDLYVKIEKIIDEDGKENLKDYEDFIKENSIFISKIDEESNEEMGDVIHQLKS